MNTLGDKLKAARKACGLHQSDVSNILNSRGFKTTRPTISKWENDTQTPQINTLKELANIYGVTLDTLSSSLSLNITPIILGKDTSNESSPQLITKDTDTAVTLPILGDVAAGMGAYAQNMIDGYEKVPSDWLTSPEDVFLKVKGDSMFPKFEEGDLLLIHPQETLENGEYGVVLIDGDNGVVKRVMLGDGWIELLSVNPSYPPRRFSGPETERVRIFGKVKKLLRNY